VGEVLHRDHPGQLIRGRQVHAAVLAAALAELAEVGYSAFTIDNVARRAGVHKTTIYRRWQGRDRLLLDALIDQIAVEVPVPDTGAIETDLQEHARSLIRWLTSPAGQAVIGAAFSDLARLPQLAGLKRRFFEDRIRRIEPVVTRAIERDELPRGTDTAQLVTSVIAPIYLRLLVTAEPLDRAAADQAVRVALTAARAGLFRQRAAEPEHEQSLPPKSSG
jgi:AcrR family transcriptional regulator